MGRAGREIPGHFCANHGGCRIISGVETPRALKKEAPRVSSIARAELIPCSRRFFECWALAVNRMPHRTAPRPLVEANPQTPQTARTNASPLPMAATVRAADHARNARPAPPARWRNGDPARAADRPLMPPEVTARRAGIVPTAARVRIVAPAKIAAQDPTADRV